MGMTMRVSLPGYDAGTDTNPDHYSLYADEDWVLIKEKTRGTVNISPSSSGTVTHNLGYVPFFAAYADDNWVYGYGIYGQYNVYATGTNLVLTNNSAGTATFKYYIFYDQEI